MQSVAPSEIVQGKMSPPAKQHGKCFGKVKSKPDVLHIRLTANHPGACPPAMFIASASEGT